MRHFYNYDRIVGIVLLIVAAVLFADTFTFKIRPFVPLNTTFWPRVILGLMVVAAIYLIFKGRVIDENPEVFSPQAGCVALGASVYVFLMPIGGFFAVSTLIGATGYYWLSDSKTHRTFLFAGIYGLIVSGVVYLVFRELLHVQLPVLGRR